MTLNTRVAQMFEEEAELKERMKNLKADLNELLEQTAVYKSVFDAAVETTKAHKVAEKVAKAHALKVARMVYAPKDEAEEA